jgi:hypothetical protein
MLRTRLAKSYIKRTIRPLYGWTQATPKSAYLDPAWDRSSPYYPGMVYAKGAGDLVTPLGLTGVTDGSGTKPYGLGALYVGGDGIDEVLDSGVNAFAVWVLGPDAEFEILAPAFDNTQTFVDGGLLFAATVASGSTLPGQLVPSTYAGTKTTAAVARCIKVNSATKITVGGLYGTV